MYTTYIDVAKHVYITLTIVWELQLTPIPKCAQPKKNFPGDFPSYIVKYTYKYVKNLNNQLKKPGPQKLPSRTQVAPIFR